MCPLHRSNTERDCGHQHQHLRGGFCLDCHLLHAGRGTVLGGVHRRRPALLHFHRIGESRFSTREYIQFMMRFSVLLAQWLVRNNGSQRSHIEQKIINSFCTNCYGLNGVEMALYGNTHGIKTE